MSAEETGVRRAMTVEGAITIAACKSADTNEPATVTAIPADASMSARTRILAPLALAAMAGVPGASWQGAGGWGYRASPEARQAKRDAKLARAEQALAAAEAKRARRRARNLNR